MAVVVGATLLITGYARAEDTTGRVTDSPSKLPTVATQQNEEPVQLGEESSLEPSEPAVLQTHEVQEPTPEEKQRAAVAQRQAQAEEQAMAARVRGLETLIQKEEQDLAQRLAHAAKLRADGLAKNDEKILQQAEQFERQSLEYYLKRVKQFESMNVTAGESSVRSPQQQQQQPTRRAQPSAPATRSAQPQVRQQPSQGTSSSVINRNYRSSQSPRTRR
jgi:hypothetical protein